MTLLLRPKGRGNWRPMKMTLEGARGGLLILPGQLFYFGGVTWRIVKVGA
jgi:hypothetical protein